MRAQQLKPRDRLKIVKDEIEYLFEVAEEGGYLVSVTELRKGTPSRRPGR